MKIKLFLLMFAVAGLAINVNAQLKVFTGGNVSIKSTSVPTNGTAMQVFGNSLFSTAVVPTSGPYIQGRSTYSPNYTSPDYTWYGDMGTGISHPAQNVMTFVSSSIEMMRIDNGYNGRVSINGAPYYNYPFSVNGSAFAFGGTWQASDIRYKKNIKKIDNALDKVLKLNGKSYLYRTDEFQSSNFDKDTTLGFIAQEIAEIIPEAVRIDSNGYYSMNYDQVIPVLVEAIKEQESKIEQLQSDLEYCCKVGINSNQKTENQNGINPDNSGNMNNSILYQNIPNPFKESTTINYYLDNKTTQASIFIFDMQGTLLKSFDISNQGKGSIVVSAGELNAGMYMYSLVVDDKEIDTKRMILTK